MLNKFRGPEDPEFLRVSRWITNFVEGALGESLRKNQVETENDMALAEKDTTRNTSTQRPGNQETTRANKVRSVGYATSDAGEPSTRSQATTQRITPTLNSNAGYSVPASDTTQPESANSGVIDEFGEFYDDTSNE